MTDTNLTSPQEHAEDGFVAGQDERVQELEHALGIAMDSEHWITTESGTHLLIESDGKGGYHITGGAGGKLNGTEVHPSSMSANRINEKTSAFNDPGFKPHEPPQPEGQPQKATTGASFTPPQGHETLKRPLKVERETEKAYGVTNPVYQRAVEIMGVGGTRADRADAYAKELSGPEREAFRERKSLNWLPKSHSFAHEGHVVSMAGWLASKGGYETHEGATEQAQRTYLHVPYDNRNEAKAAGAKWDGSRKQWYHPGGELPDDLKKFQSGNRSSVAAKKPVNEQETKTAFNNLSERTDSAKKNMMMPRQNMINTKICKTKAERATIHTTMI